MKRKILFILSLILLSFLGYNYLFPDHRTIYQEEAKFTIDASVLFNNFIENPKLAESKFLDQTITIYGVVTSLQAQGVTINNKIFCNLENLSNKHKVNDQIVIKGRCIGYDELLEEVKLDQCSIVK